MSDTQYISSPVASEYKTQNSEAITRALDYSKLSHRLIGAKDKNIRLNAPSSFKYFESTMFSTKDVSFVESDVSMLNNSFLDSMKSRAGVVYKVLKFNRKHNMRSFDFVLSYTQNCDWASEAYKTVPVTKKYIGSILFSGCSNIKDTTTYENLPLELHARFESVGGSIGTENSVDGMGDSKGGPAITITYSYTSDYVYLFISSISPCRIIPRGNGEYVDISYVEDAGLFTGEIKSQENIRSNVANNESKKISFTRNPAIHCEVEMSIRDTSISNTDSDILSVNYSDEITGSVKTTIDANAKTFTLRPTNGEICTVGFTPANDTDLEIATEITPVTFTSRLLNKDMESVNSYISKITELIKKSSVDKMKIPFIIKSVIRTRGKYNVRGNYFIDSNSDSYGKVLIEEVGTYDAITDTFDITEYVFDKDKQINLGTFASLKSLIGGNASDYLKSISNSTDVSYTTKVTTPMSLISKINYVEQDKLNVYSEVSFIRSSSTFETLKAFVELADDSATDNLDSDNIIYFCKDNTVRVCGFSDYDMTNAVTYYPFESFDPELLSKISITSVERTYNANKGYTYFIGTNLGILAILNISGGKSVTTFKRAFSNSDSIISTRESVNVMIADDKHIVIGGSEGSVSIYNKSLDTFSYPEKRFISGEVIKATSLSSTGDVETIATNRSIASYDISNNKWLTKDTSYDADFYNSYIGFANNADLISNKMGSEGVPSVQCGKFIYTLGLRKETSGYSPVYSKMNIETGEVTQVAVPNVPVYGGKLAIDNKHEYIYCIGGTSESDPDTVSDPSTIKTYIAKLNTLTDTWVVLPANYVTIIRRSDLAGDTDVYRKITSVYPVITDDGSVYLFKPLVTYYVKDSVSGDITSAIKYDDCAYKIEIKSDTITSTSIELSDDSFSVIKPAQYTMYPISTKASTIVFISSGKTVNAKTDGTYDFTGYKVNKITVSLADVVTCKVESITFTNYELSQMYSSTNYIYAKDDLFKDAALCNTGKAVFAYIQDSNAGGGIFVINYSSALSADFYLLYHTYDTSLSAHKPLLTKLDNEQISSSGKIPTNIFLANAGNNILFIGGNSDRNAEVLDITDYSNIAFLRTPTSVARNTNSNNGNSTLPIDGSFFRFVATDKMVCDSIGKCAAKNATYFIAVESTATQFNIGVAQRTMMFRMDPDKDKGPSLFKDLTSKIATYDSSKIYTEYVGFNLGDSVVCFYPTKALTKDVSGTYISDTSVSGHFVVAVNVDNGDVTIIPMTSVAGINNRFIIKNDLFKEAYVLGQSTSDITIAKGFKFSVDSSNAVVYGEVSLPGLGGLVSVPDKSYSVAESVSYGKYSFVVDNASISVIDFAKIRSGITVDSFSKLTNVFDNSAFNKDLSINKGKIYISGGTIYNSASLLGQSFISYKFDAEDLIKSFGVSDYVIDKTVTVFNLAVSSIYAPMAITDKVFCVVGNSEVFTGNQVITLPLARKINISDVSYIKPYVGFELETVSSSQYNRHSPHLHTMIVNGRLLLIMFGGKQGTNTAITKAVDAYDVAKRTWFALPDLPYALKNVSILNNTIIGATKINDDTFAESACKYAYTLTANDTEKDYSANKYTWIPSSLVANSTAIPTYAKYGSSFDASKTYIVGTDESGLLTNDSSNIVVEGTSVKVLPNLTVNITKDIIYKVLGVVGSKYSSNSVYVILYCAVSKTIYVWKYNGSEWSTVSSLTDIVEDFAISDFNGSTSIVVPISNTAVKLAEFTYLDLSEKSIKCICLSESEAAAQLYYDSSIYGIDTGLKCDYSSIAALTRSSSGWSFMVDSVNNIHYAIQPCTKKISFNAVTTIGYENDSGKINTAHNGKEYSLVVDGTSLKFVSGSTTIDTGLTYSSTLGYKLFVTDDYIIIAIKKTDSVEIMWSKNGTTLSFTSLSTVSGLTESGLNKHIEVKPYTNDLIYIVVSGITVDLITAKYDSTTMTATNVYRNIVAVGSKFATVYWDEDSVGFISYDSTKSVSTYYNYTLSSSKITRTKDLTLNMVPAFVLSEQSGKFYAYNYDFAISGDNALKCFIVNNESVYPVEDKGCCAVVNLTLLSENFSYVYDNVLYIPGKGLSISMIDTLDKQFGYLNTGMDAVSTSHVLGDYIFRVSKEMKDVTDTSSTLYRISTYDRYTQKCLMSYTVTKSNTDTVVDELVVPVNCKYSFYDIVNSTLHFYLIDNSIIYDFNCKTGSVTRHTSIAFVEVVNSIPKSYKTPLIPNKVFITLGTDSYYYTFDTLTGDITSTLISSTLVNHFISEVVNISYDMTSGKIYSKYDGGNLEEDFSNGLVVDRLIRHLSTNTGLTVFNNSAFSSTHIDRTRSLLTTTYDEIEGYTVENDNGSLIVRKGSAEYVLSNTQFAWSAVVSDILYVGIKTLVDSSYVLSKVIALVYSGKNTFAFKEIPLSGDVSKYALGDAVGVSTAKFTDTANSITYEGHIVIGNNPTTNRVFELVPEYTSTDLTKLTSLNLSAHEIYAYGTTTDDVIYKKIMIKTRNNIVLMLGSNNSTSKRIIFDSKYYWTNPNDASDAHMPTVNEFGIQIAMAIDPILAFMLSDSLFTVVYDGTTWFIYEMILSVEGSIKRTARYVVTNSGFECAFVINKNYACAKNDRLVYSNNRFSCTFDASKYCSGYDNDLIDIESLNTALSSSEIKSITISDGKLYLGFVSSLGEYVKIRCSDHLMYRNLLVHSTSTSGVAAFRYGNVNHELIRDDTSYYDDTWKVAIINNTTIKIKDTDGVAIMSYSIGDTNSPFVYDILPVVFSYKSGNTYDGDRFLVFTDIKGNVSTFDRNLKVFVDVNGNIDVSVPYFSTECSILPAKVIDEGSVGKRVWAFNSDNPYSTDINADVDKISKIDSTLLD